MIRGYPHGSRRLSAGSAACLIVALGAAVHPASGHAADTSAQDSSQSGGQALNEIVVTAQKYKQRQQDVPISITALSGSTLANANVTTTYDLPTLVSGLLWSNEGAWATPSIRGVSTTDASDGAPSPVAIYVDGVYEPDESGTLMDLPDISSIQVLKGPQGTLYGQNAVAGAIVVNTLGPSFTPTGRVDVTGGYIGGGSSHDSGHYGASAFVSGPLVGDTLAGSISAYYDDIDGYLTNDLNGHSAGRIDADNVRGKLLWKPADGVSILATAYYIHREDGVAETGFPYDDATAAKFYPGAVVPTQPYHIAYDGPTAPNVATNARGANLNATFDLGLGTLTSITGYTNYSVLVDASSGDAYSPGCIAVFSCVNAAVSEPDTTWSQEIDFASKQLGAFRFVTGVYAFHDDALAYITYNSLAFITDTLVKTTSYSGFGEVTYDATSNLSVTAGLRVTHDEIKAWGYLAAPPVLPYANKGWTAATPRASLVYKLSPVVNTYFTYSEGFKGGVASGEYTVAPPANPEKLYSYELGVKAAQSRYMVDLAAYYYDYKDLQVETLVDQGTVTEPQNAADAKLYGLDFDGTYKWSDAFQTRLDATYLAHAEYSSFPAAITYVPPLGPFGLVTDNDFDASGTRMLDAPLWTGTVAGTYTKDLTGGVLQATGSVYWASSYRWEYTGRIQTPGYYLLNAQLNYSPHSSNFRYTLYGKNLANKAYIDGVTPSSANSQAFYAQPREIGVKIDYSW